MGSSNVLSTLLPQALCSCWSFCLGLSFLQLFHVLYSLTSFRSLIKFLKETFPDHPTSTPRQP